MRRLWWPALTAVGLLQGTRILAQLGTARWPSFQVRDLNFTVRAIFALTIGYSAFISEIFRAGIESIGRGQMEAARSLGMSYGQAMRYVILPQAVRNVLPPLGNDFIAMLKDSSLVSVLGVQDITQIGKVYSASTFRFFETYNVVAYLYLVMTVGLALRACEGSRNGCRPQDVNYNHSRHLRRRINHQVAHRLEVVHLPETAQHPDG